MTSLILHFSYSWHTQQWKSRTSCVLSTLQYWDGKNTFYYKCNPVYFVQSSYWYLKKWTRWHVHYHQNCSTNLSTYSITSIVRVTIVWVSTSPQKICYRQGRFYVGYRNWLSAYVFVHTCLTSVTVLSFSYYLCIVWPMYAL